MVFRIAWTDAPRWLLTPLYIALGWAVVFFLPQFHAGSDKFPTWVNVSTFTLIAATFLRHAAWAAGLTILVSTP